MFGRGRRDPNGGPRLTEDVADEARRLVNEGRHIQAIAVIRQHTGLGLKEAKAIADDMSEGRPVPVAYGPGQIGPVQTPPPARGPVRGPVLTDDAMRQVMGLIDQGKTIQAIKEVRGHTGLGLKEAKEAVQDIAEGRPTPIAPAPRVSLADRVRTILAQDQPAAAVHYLTVEAGMTETEAARFIEYLD